VARSWIGFALLAGVASLGASRLGWARAADELLWPGAIQDVEERLRSDDVQVRRAASAELNRLPDSVQRRLLPVLFSDPDPELRLVVADAALQLRLSDAGARVVKWLNDPDARVRAAAAEVLGVLPHPGSASALGRVLEDPEPAVRAAAALALGSSDGADASLFLLGHLDDGDPEVRHAVLSALEDLGDARAVVPLIGRIQEPRAPLRRQAIAALGTLGDTRASSALIVALSDADATVRAAAATSLGKLRFGDAVWSLGALLETESDPDVQAAVLHALGTIGSPSAVDAILGASSRRRWSGARIERALASAGEGAVPSLGRCLFPPIHPQVARSCVAALGSIGSEAARQLVLRALREGVVEPERALRALGDCGDASTLPAVLEYLTSASPAERRAAIDAAGQLLHPDQQLGFAVEPIALALERAQNSRLERAALIGLLGRTGSPRAAAVLIPIAKSTDEYLRAIALEGLGQLASAGADSVLVAALDSPLFPTRWTAAIALRRSGTRASIDSLLERLERAPSGPDETLAVALAGPLADGASEAQLARVVARFQTGSGALKDALLDALAGVSGSNGSRQLLELMPGLGKASRAKLAEALGAHPEARAALLTLSSDADPAVRANAVWSLGAAATSEDLPLLSTLRESDDIAVSGNAVAALARVARRLGLDASQPLCAALSDHRSYVLVNALSGVRLTGARCPEPQVVGWLLQHHPSDEVRMAAARLLREHAVSVQGAAGLLARCTRKDVSGRVAAECQAPASPVRAESGAPVVAVSVLVVPTGSNAPSPRAPFALVLADGSIRSGTCDRRGSVSETNAPRGSLRLAVPAVFSE
jgi:cellulose synthase operon protein C